VCRTTCRCGISFYESKPWSELTWQATDKTISLVSFRATAVGTVVGVDANRVLRAGVANVTGMLANLADARLRQRAVFIAIATR